MGNVTTAREALMAELLKDVGALVERLEAADKILGGKIEQATADAAGKAFLAAKLNFEAMIDAQAVKITDAGRHAASMIGNQLNAGAAHLLDTNTAAENKARRLVVLVAAVALLAGIIGGFIGAKLSGSL